VSPDAKKPLSLWDSGFFLKLVANQGFATDSPKALSGLVFRLLHPFKIAGPGSSSSAKFQRPLREQVRSAGTGRRLAAPRAKREGRFSDGACARQAQRDLITCGPASGRVRR